MKRWWKPRATSENGDAEPIHANARWANLGIAIPRVVRYPVAILLALAVVISAAFLASASDQDRQATTEVIRDTQYRCQHKGTLGYDVRLLPNDVYTVTTLGPGQSYFSKLIDRIEATASYEFTGDKSATLSGRYTATADFQADGLPTRSFPITLGVPKSSFSFDHQASLNYRVHLKPNTLYTTPTLDPGLLYFTNIVDHIAVTGSYNLQAGDPSSSTGQYTVSARIVAEGYWEKTRIIQPTTTFDAGGKNTSFTHTFDIDVAAFRQFADEVNEELGINARKVDMIVEFSVELNARTEDRMLSDALTPTLTIPLTGTSFTLGGIPYQQNSGVLRLAGAGSEEIAFTADGTGVLRTEAFDIDLAPYYTLVDLIADQTGVPVRNPQLRIVYDIDASVTVEGKPLTPVKLTPQMTIPLSGTTFEILGNLTVTKPQVLETTETVTIPPPPRKGTGGQLSSLVVFCILLIGFIAATRNKAGERIDPIEREANSIKRKYSDRMVETTHQPEAPAANSIALSSMDDMDRIAEQLAKPIFHHPPAAPGQPHFYYVIDGTTRYHYELNNESLSRPDPVQQESGP